MSLTLEASPVDCQAADDRLKRTEAKLKELEEKKRKEEQETNHEIGRLESEIRDLEVKKEVAREEEFFSEDKSRLTGRLKECDREIDSHRKRIEKLRASTGEKAERLQEKIDEISVTYLEEAKEMLPALYDNVCLAFKKQRTCEQALFPAIVEVIDRFLKMNDEAVQARSRYANILFRLKPSQKIPEVAISNMEAEKRRQWGLTTDPRKCHESLVFDKARELKVELLVR